MRGLTIEDLHRIARRVRRDIITMTGTAGSGHPSSSLSAVEIITALFFSVMRHDPARPGWPDRDRFILSKGHAAPVLYAALARCGYFPVEKLLTLRKLGSPLQGHPEKGRLPGVEASTGSLGQGISLGVGMALAGRADRRDYRVYVLIGDGEADEGQVWEAALCAAKYRIDTLTVIMDCNGQQQDGWVREIMPLEPLADKWEAFGWQSIDIDGHDLSQILEAIRKATITKGKPTVIIARTIKGKGVSYMENRLGFHGIAPTKEQMEEALRELGQGEGVSGEA